jgi:hypothetical protein
MFSWMIQNNFVFETGWCPFGQGRFGRFDIDLKHGEPVAQYAMRVLVIDACIPQCSQTNAKDRLGSIS